MDVPTLGSHGSQRRPRIAVTLGDPAGIGPEIVLKALASSEPPDADVTVYGSLAVLRDRAKRLGLPAPESLEAAFVDVPLSGPIALGQTSSVGGRAAAEAVVKAAQDAMAGRVAGLVTGPLNKESLRSAGYSWPGHTEMLAESTGCSNVVMMFVGGGLRVALLTIHRSLASVATAITSDEIKRVTRLVHRELPRFKAGSRRIALCGLNPHAGEGGRFGREELETMLPAVAALQEEAIDVSGPFPADTLFVRATRGEFDAVVAAYHDQGLIPVKLVAFGRAVNVTLGLPFVRTSVDHGTAFDIVERGCADPGSLLAAMRLAVDLTSLDRFDQPRSRIA